MFEWRILIPARTIGDRLGALVHHPIKSITPKESLIGCKACNDLVILVLVDLKRFATDDNDHSVSNVLLGSTIIDVKTVNRNALVELFYFLFQWFILFQIDFS